MINTLKKEEVSTRITKEDIFSGCKMATPICLGYIPLGIACGILSQKAGLSPIEIGALSLFVYAGSGQFVTASMLISQASIISIIFATFIINLRHILMSSSLSPFFSRCSKKFLMLFSHGITDESFALNLMKFKENNWTPNKALVLNIASHVVWIGSNILGGVTGSLFNFNDMIINFVLTSMFICLLTFQLKGFIYVLCALVSGGIAVSLSLVMNNNLYIIIATLLAATICYFVEKAIHKSTKEGLRDDK